MAAWLWNDGELEEELKKTQLGYRDPKYLRTAFGKGSAASLGKAVPPEISEAKPATEDDLAADTDLTDVLGAPLVKKSVKNGSEAASSGRGPDSQTRSRLITQVDINSSRLWAAIQQARGIQSVRSQPRTAAHQHWHSYAKPTGPDGSRETVGSSGIIGQGGARPTA